ncbi:MAG TPA: response regulator [Flavipsychrobacter sp.]|nr:response regulator [Flavipsychrobacter sp.]
MKTEISILIADDDIDDIEFIRDAFHRSAFAGSLQFFRNGDNLMAYLLQSKQAYEQEHAALPQLLLLDLNMPMKDGYEVLKEIKADVVLKNVPIIVVSSSPRMDEEERCIGMGCRKYYKKPISLAEYDELVGGIYKFLETA